MSLHLLPNLAGPTALALLLCAGSAWAGARVPVEGAPITVEVPGNWIIAPVSTDAPQLTLNLCDPMVREGCLLRGEMQIEQLLGARAPASLDALWTEAKSIDQSAQRLLPPSRTRVAGREAVETSSVGEVIYDYVGGGASTAKQGFLAVTLQDGTSYYRCSTSAAPERIAGLRDDLVAFCNSIQFIDSSSQSGQQ